MQDTRSDALRGIWLMIAAMGAFALADTLIKLAADTMSRGQTLTVLILGGLAIFIVITRAQGDPIFHPEAFSKVLLLRYLSELVGTFAMIKGLAEVDLSTVGAILQATPLVVVLGAILFLGERVSWRRWSAILVGFFGVLLIIRPGTQGFDLNVLWPVLAMLGLAGRDLTTRAAPQGMASSTLATLTMAALAPFAVLLCLIEGVPLLPAEPNWWLIIGMTSFGALGYLLIIASVRAAEVSVVSPFRYSRLIFLLALGVTVFGERPDALTLLGAVIIMGSGVYTMWRDRQIKAAKG